MSLKERFIIAKARLKRQLRIGAAAKGSISSLAETRGPSPRPPADSRSETPASETRATTTSSNTLSQVIISSHSLQTPIAATPPTLGAFTPDPDAMTGIAPLLSPPDITVGSYIRPQQLPGIKKEPAWAGLRTLLRAVDSSSDIFPPLKSAVDGLNACVEMFEEASKQRKEHQELANQLDSLLGDLSGTIGNISGSKITMSIKNLCIALNGELGILQTRLRRGRIQSLEPTDEEETTQSYRRIQGHLQRLVINSNLNMWETVNEMAMESRLRGLSPSIAAFYNSAESEVVRRRGCTPGTRESELRRLLDWARSELFEATNVYWVNGMAGTGKTTIAYSVCFELEMNAELGASFFCSRLIPECRNIKFIFPSIAYQLARFSHPFRSALLASLEADPDLHTRVLRVQFDGLLVRPLDKVKDALPADIVIVIDALDECDHNEAVEQMLDILLDHSAGFGLPLRFILTSRPEPGIYYRMMNKPDKSPHTRLVLHELDEQVVKHDIETYLRMELAVVQPTPSQLRSLADNCGALFIYASTAARYIKEGMPFGQHEERLNAILGLTPQHENDSNREIDALYSHILRVVFRNEQFNERMKKTLKMLLDVVICAQEPMTVDAIAGLLGAGSGRDVNALLQRLSSVLNIAESAGLVTTLHASFPDYMLDETRSETFRCDADAVNAHIADACFDVIKSVKPPFNICQLTSSYIRDDEVAGFDQRAHEVVSSQLFYASRYWMSHLDRGSSKPTQPLWDFLSMRLLLWMEVLNVTHTMRLGPGIMQRTESWCRNNSLPEEFIDLAHDAWRFVLMFTGHAVSESTPHIYISMLPFWPKSAPIANHYLSRTQSAVQVRNIELARRELALLTTWMFDDQVLSASPSPDGSLIAFGLSSSIYLIDGFTGKAVLAPLLHDNLVSSVGFSPDGTLIISGSFDQTIRLWRTSDGNPVTEPIRGHLGYVLSVSFFPDGERIVSGSTDSTIRIWSSKTGRTVVGPIDAHDSWVTSVCVSGDGTRIASGSRDMTIRVWDSDSGVIVLGPLEGHSDLVRSVRFSPDCTRIASGSDDKTIQIWDAEDGQKLNIFQGHADGVTSIAFSPNGKHIVSSGDLTLRLWDVEGRGHPEIVLEGHTDTVGSVAFSPDGKRIISSSLDKTIRVWDTEGQAISNNPFQGHTNGVLSVAFSHDGTHILSGSGDKTVCMWDTQSGQLALGPLRGHTHWVHAVCFSPDDSQAASSSEDSTIRLWDIASGSSLGEPLRGHYGGVHSVSFSPENENVLASGSEDHTLRLWNAPNMELLANPLIGHTRWIWSVCFTPDGSKLISGSNDKTILVWDVESGQPVLPAFTGHTGAVLTVGISPDGIYIASGSSDETVRLWDATTGRSIFSPFQGHTGPVRSVSFSPDSHYLVSGSDDKTLRLWDVGSGQAIHGPLTGHTEAVRTTCFSPSGHWAASGSDDGVIRMWYIGDLVKAHQIEGISWVLIEQPFLPTLKFMAEPHWRPNTLNSDDTSLGSQSLVFQEDGWVVDSQMRLLVWVPPDLRTGLMHPRNPFLISIKGSLQLIVDYTKLGEYWSQAYKVWKIGLLLSHDEISFLLTHAH